MLHSGKFYGLLTSHGTRIKFPIRLRSQSDYYQIDVLQTARDTLTHIEMIHITGVLTTWRGTNKGRVQQDEQLLITLWR